MVRAYDVPLSVYGMVWDLVSAIGGFRCQRGAC